MAQERIRHSARQRPKGPRRPDDSPATQMARREATREALLASAAKGLSRYGYSGLILEKVAADAGYTRGALYHQFKNKEELALAVIGHVAETWWEEVGPLAVDRESEPVEALIALAQGHAVYCRRDVARVISTLRAEFGDQDHPVGRVLNQGMNVLIERHAELIAAGRADGSIPPGPPTPTLARTLVGAIEGAIIAADGAVPTDVEVAERVVRGVIGVEPR